MIVPALPQTDDRYGDRMARIRILVVDDHRSYADALTIAIGIHHDLLSVGTAASVAEALRTVRATTPDVVLLDIHLPDGDGIDAMSDIRLASPDTRILILTGYTDVQVLARAATAGASGFVPKESSIERLIDAIRAASTGTMLMEGTLLAAILGRASAAAPRERGTTQEAPLTPREHDVLLLMGQGMDPHAIATSLRISLYTCRGYQKAIMGKLHAHSQLETVVVATRRGLLPRTPATR